MTAPLFSLVVCTVDRVDQLRRLLDSLLVQSNKDFEVIVVDQNEDDRLFRLLGYYSNLLPLSKTKAPRGLSASRNVGIRLARGEIIGFPDDDCWYYPDTLYEVARHFSPTLDVLNGRTVDVTGADSINQYLHHPTPIDKWNVWNAHNSNALFMRREAIQRLQGFDETLGIGPNSRFPAGEDVDIVLRALEMGMLAAYDPRISVLHEQVIGRTYSKAELQRSRRYAPGFGRLLRIHNYGVSYLAYRLARSLGAAGVAAIRGDTWKARYKLAWAGGTLTGYLARI